MFKVRIETSLFFLEKITMEPPPHPIPHVYNSVYRSSQNVTSRHHVYLHISNKIYHTSYNSFTYTFFGDQLSATISIDFPLLIRTVIASTQGEPTLYTLLDGVTG